jgi:hypothetical protein
LWVSGWGGWVVGQWMVVVGSGLAWLDQPCAGTLDWGTPPEVDPCLRLRQPNDCSPLPRPFRPVTPWPRCSGCSLGGLLQPLLPVAGCLGTWVLFSPAGVADLRVSWDFPVPAPRFPAFPPGVLSVTKFLGYHGFAATAPPSFGLVSRTFVDLGGGSLPGPGPLFPGVSTLRPFRPPGFPGYQGFAAPAPPTLGLAPRTFVNLRRGEIPTGVRAPDFPV